MPEKMQPEPQTDPILEQLIAQSEKLQEASQQIRNMGEAVATKLDGIKKPLDASQT